MSGKRRTTDVSKTFFCLVSSSLSLSLSLLASFRSPAEGRSCSVGQSAGSVRKDGQFIGYCSHFSVFRSAVTHYLLARTKYKALVLG